MSTKDQLIEELEPLFSSYLSDNPNMEVISLATTDGFPVFNVMVDNKFFEADKMAAASSTLYSVSNAVTQQILDKRFKIAFIETEQGNVAFVSLELLEKDFVLTMSARQAMNIASLRMLINRLAKEIRELRFESEIKVDTTKKNCNCSA